MEPDFSGYATKSGIKCADGRTILPNAFKANHGTKVPLVWQHQHNNPDNVLGHALLQNRDDGVYAYAFLNDSKAAETTRQLIKHGDINQMSIYANKLVQDGDDVSHGAIREVSLVLSGANPGALIDNITLQHGDTFETVRGEAVIYTGLSLQHEDTDDNDTSSSEDSDDSEETVEDVFNTLSEKQKNVVYYMLGEVVDGDDDDEDDEDDDDETDTEDAEHSDMKGDTMSQNVFDQNNKTSKTGPTLTHDQLTSIMDDAHKTGSFKESFLAHAQQYGITDIDVLFPDAQNVTPTPTWVKRDTGWVAGVMNGTKSTPFSRIKSMSADITHEEARALGYIKGNMKKEEFFGVKARETSPKTIYKKQKLDRDDIIDITDLDVVAWLKAEMRMMLEEEIARAILMGDGREVDSEDKISEENIRPIAKDHDFYAHQISVPTNINAKDLTKAVVRSRKHYKGTGSPTFYTTEDVLTDLLLEEDRMGRRLYETEASLAAALRVSNIVTVEVMESEPELLGILVNIADYTVGADKGGKVSMFDDFDIDYNQYKYLIETRISGALTKPKSAIVIRRSAGAQVTPTAPQQVGNILDIPSITGVTYTIDSEEVSGETEITDNVTVEAHADEGYFFTPNVPTDWAFTHQQD